MPIISHIRKLFCCFTCHKKYKLPKSPEVHKYNLVTIEYQKRDGSYASIIRNLDVTSRIQLPKNTLKSRSISWSSLDGRHGVCKIKNQYYIIPKYGFWNKKLTPGTVILFDYINKNGIKCKRCSYVADDGSVLLPKDLSDNATVVWSRTYSKGYGMLDSDNYLTIPFNPIRSSNSFPE